MGSSVLHLSPLNFYFYVQEEHLGSTRQFVENYLLFACIANQNLALQIRSVGCRNLLRQQKKSSSSPRATSVACTDTGQCQYRNMLDSVPVLADCQFGDCRNLLIVYVYYQPNSCNTHAEHEWAGGTFLRQRKKVPPAHAQQVYVSICLSIRPFVHLSIHLSVWNTKTIIFLTRN